MKLSRSRHDFLLVFSSLFWRARPHVRPSARRTRRQYVRRPGDVPSSCRSAPGAGTSPRRHPRPTGRGRRHREQSAPSSSQVRKGAGIASSLGTTTRAIAAKGEGLQACATPTSARMLRSTKASSRLIPHSSASSRAASRHASRMASGYSTAVPWAIQVFAHRSRSEKRSQRS